MGTSGAYTGGGGRTEKEIQEVIKSWIDSFPPTQSAASRNNRPRIPNRVGSLGSSLFRSDGGGGGGGVTGGGGRRGGAQRSVVSSSRTAGRASAAAYAYIRGDRAALSNLGLNYDELRLVEDPIEVASQIVNAACGSLSDSTIDHEEQRAVAASVAEWVLAEDDAGMELQPERIVRKTIALVIEEAIASETGALLSSGEYPTWMKELAQNQISEGLEVLAEQADLTPGGPTADEFATAIQDGLDAMRGILGWTD